MTKEARTVEAHQLAVLWFHTLSIAIVSDTSNIPQSEVGNHLGLHPYLCWRLLLCTASCQVSAGGPAKCCDFGRVCRALSQSGPSQDSTCEPVREINQLLLATLVSRLSR